jgi:DNA-binding beta-propeller fold protein YncE
VIRTIPGLSEPQGVGYEPWTDTLFVANARDGSVHLFDGNDYKSTGRIELGSDADNIRVDAAAKRVVIGYGGGALAIIDPATRSKLSDIPLKAHPESFQLDPDSGLAFVNVPGVRAVAVVDRTIGKQVGAWPMDRSGNFPMIIVCQSQLTRDPKSHRTAADHDHIEFIAHDRHSTHLAMCAIAFRSVCI